MSNAHERRRARPVRGDSLTVNARGPRTPLGLDLYRPVPRANPLTREKVALGRRLFHDRRLSRNGSMACASCHDPRRAFTNGARTARGASGSTGIRNVPTLVNRAWGSSFFWDGRAATLEQQALGPILNPDELGATPDGVLTLARSSRYRPEFAAAFGGEPNIFDVAGALASYMRTIVAGGCALRSVRVRRDRRADRACQTGLRAVQDSSALHHLSRRASPVR